LSETDPRPDRTRSDRLQLLRSPPTLGQCRGLQRCRASRRLCAVPLDVFIDPGHRVAGPEVGAVAAEDLDPLLACVVDRVGDQVSDIAMAAAGHAYVRRCCAGGLADDEVGGVDGFTLSTIGGRGEGELDVSVDVVGGQLALAGAAGDDEAAVASDTGNGPDVAVGDAEVAVVAARGDAITGADPFTTAGDGLTFSLTISLTSVVAAVANCCVDGSDLLAGVGDDQLVTGCADVGECVGALDLAGVDDDLAACDEIVEDLTRALTARA
jgi:hypothetical protein